jgi:hypothetical protein
MGPFVFQAFLCQGVLCGAFFRGRNGLMAVIRAVAFCHHHAPLSFPVLYVFNPVCVQTVCVQLREHIFTILAQISLGNIRGQACCSI